MAKRPIAKDPKVDAFIEARPEWQRVIMQDLRSWLHASSDRIEENMRWGAPHFDHAGIMVGFMGFKKHINLFFHKGALIDDPEGLFEKTNKDKGSRSVKFMEGDVPDRPGITALFKQAMMVNERGTKLFDAKPKSTPLRSPSDLMVLLKKRTSLLERWKAMAPSRRKEYVEWITAAKRAETREERLKLTVEMIAEGRGLHDKYR